MKGPEARQLRETTGLSQFRAAKLLGIGHGRLSSIERSNERLPRETEAQLLQVVAAWRAEHGGRRPDKRSAGKTGLARPPASPPVVTACCGPTRSSDDAPDPGAGRCCRTGRPSAAPTTQKAR